MADYFRFSEQEEEYFLLLVQRDRAHEPKYQKKLDQKIGNLQKRALNLTNHIQDKATEMKADWMPRYYSDWSYGAIHILTAIKDFQTPERMALKLGLSLERVLVVLKELEEMNLVAKSKKDLFVHTGHDFHLPGTSAFNRQNHLNWRLKAIENMQFADNLHYSSVFALSKKDIPIIKAQTLEFIESKRVRVTESGAEDLLCFCLDFFNICS